ncbi:TPA: helix-turn-helix transcriptional regulator [Clostridioides difficile]|uniref:helix-turn-helix domain-containing protein n=1 Tax=Clostridioides difficile TaxID=1496 RepID=UPI0003B29A4A|nr:helix-turn-helix transcriptional regulator [Clostridioides difficile]MBJ9769296.1 helix-turn-helix transcriptional regulator [Clostridioides difficile]MCE0686053.1 helix-turn-helix domain-containing protein [Clostridioides difficile]MCE0713354.1 helix-turn-helix domain-containing protein [Clostridioides difficile]MCE0720778.1 helix-turn-helix domain-containing protein [Clostridioides difficile]MCE0730288.1 helix-turn-helix domain-containing protein [Clostridioides difficile]
MQTKTNKEKNKEIGSRLKKIREEKKITQSDFASSLRISRSHLAGLETGAKNFTNRILDDLYNFYGINKDWLLDGSGDKYVDLLEEIDADDEIKEMTRMYLKLDDEMKNVVKKFMLSAIEEADNENKKVEE